MELFWQNEVLRKRRSEQNSNEDKLLEAREKLLNVQLQLSLLIEKKQEKADEMVAKAQKYFFCSLFRDLYLVQLIGTTNTNLNFFATKFLKKGQRIKKKRKEMQ